MGKKRIRIAIAYDFDGTLSPGNMQEYNFIPALGLQSNGFWKKVKQNAKEHDADEILIYMNLMLEEARHKKIAVKRQNFIDFGRDIELFEGVIGWFDRLDQYGKNQGI